MDHNSTTSPYPTAAYTINSALAHSWPLITSVPQQDAAFGLNHLQHFDVYQQQCPQPYITTTAASSVSPQPSVDLDFSILLPHYNSPSPTQTASLEQMFVQGSMADSSVAVTNPYHNKRSKTDHQSRSANKSLKAVKKHVQKRASRSSPIFPSCSTPISMIGQCGVQSRSPATTTKISLTKQSKDKLPKSIASTDQTYMSLSIVLQHSQSMQQLKDIETKILRLQADRGRLLKLAQERSHLGRARLCPQRNRHSDNSLNLYLSTVEQYRHVENGLIEDGNCLTFKIGELYSSLDCAIERCVSLCSSGQSSINDISDCFPYINSLFSAEKCTTKVRVQLEHESNFIHLELCNSSTTSSSSSDGSQIILDTLNQILYHSQTIQQYSNEITRSLQSLKTKIQEMLNKIEETMKSSSLETKLCIQSVIEGNLSVVCAMQQIWERTEKYGMETLATITDSLGNGWPAATCH